MPFESHLKHLPPKEYSTDFNGKKAVFGMFCHHCHQHLGEILRQNIDEKWKEDPRRKALAKRLGDRASNGIRVELNWLILDHKGRPIPLKEFRFVEDYEVIIECGLAEVEGDMVRIVGADRYEEFFEKQKENGQKGGRPKASERKPKKPKKTQNNPTETQTKPENPSSSFSSSISFSKKEEIQNTNTSQALPAVVGENPVKLYCDEYKTRYGHNPVVGPKQAGILTQFAKSYPGKWQELIRGYLQMPDTWAVQRSHPVELLSSKLNEIQRYIQTGKVVTKKVAQTIEELADKAQGSHRRPRRSLEEIEREKQAMLDEAHGRKAIEGAG